MSRTQGTCWRLIDRIFSDKLPLYVSNITAVPPASLAANLMTSAWLLYLHVLDKLVMEGKPYIYSYVKQMGNDIHI